MNCYRVRYLENPGILNVVAATEQEAVTHAGLPDHVAVEVIAQNVEIAGKDSAHPKVASVKPYIAGPPQNIPLQPDELAKLRKLIGE